MESRNEKSQELLITTLIKSFPEAVRITDSIGLVIYANFEYCSLIGFQENNLIGKSFDSIYENEAITNLSELYQKILSEGKIQELSDIEKLLTSRKINQKCIDIVNSILIIENEKYLISIFRKKVINDTEHRYKYLIENSGEAILFTFPDGTIQYANPEACRIFNRTEEEIYEVGRNGIVDLNDSRLPLALEERKRTGKFSGELNLRKKDGKIFPGYVSTVIFKDSEGRERTSMIIRDLTEQKINDERIRNNERKISSIYLSAPVGIGMVVNRIINEVNDHLCTLTGYTRSELIGKSARIFYPSDKDYEFVGEEKYRQIYEKGIGAVETIWKRKDGMIINVLLSSAPINPCDIKEGVTFTALDITDRKNAEEKLIKSELNLNKINSEKDKLFSILAHDLKNPFTGFLGLTEIISSSISEMTPEEIQSISNNLNNSAQNLYKLLTNLLEWAQMQKNGIIFKPERCNLKKIVDEFIISNKFTFEKKDVDVKNNLDEGLFVFADNNMLNSIIRNLVSNAIKFTRKNGKVNISAEKKSEDEVEICIADTGIGINKEMLNKLFTLNAEVRRKGTENEPSSGLGLILCKEFIEKNGGKIRVKSEEFVGSKFYFTLKIARNS